MSSFTQALIIDALFVLHVLAALSACHALLHKRDSSSALGWVALLLFMPPAGLIFYWLFGIARIDSHASKLMEQAARQVINGSVDLHGGQLAQDPWGAVPEAHLPDAFRHLILPGRLIAGRNAVGGNAILPLHNGKEAYPAMLEAIAHARRRVYLSTFIFDDDEVGGRFAAALREAAERGCDTRLLLDGVGSFHPFAHWRQRLGPKVRLAYFLPPGLFPPQLSINLRTHRKVLACDGICAFAGGMNISQNHLTELARPDRVQDLHFRCAGPIARQLEVAFLLDWRFVSAHAARHATDPAAPIAVPAPARRTKKATVQEAAELLRPDLEPLLAETPPQAALAKRQSSNLFPPKASLAPGFTLAPESEADATTGTPHGDPGTSSFIACPLPGQSLCRIHMDGPGSPDETIQDLFCAMISAARTSVRIMSPYFLPPQRLAGALTGAVLRGVEVSVIVPEKNNHRLVDWAMHHQLPPLAQKGVHIFYQPPPFAHTKLMIIDQAYTLLGSANLDPRSLNLNFELVMEVFDTELAARLTAFYDAVLERSGQVTSASPCPALPQRLRNAASWIFSPYL